MYRNGTSLSGMSDKEFREARKANSDAITHNMGVIANRSAQMRNPGFFTNSIKSNQKEIRRTQEINRSRKEAERNFDQEAIRRKMKFQPDHSRERAKDRLDREKKLRNYKKYDESYADAY